MATRRGNNEGSVYKTDDGRWRASIDLGYHNGKRVRKLLSGQTRAEVAEKLTAALRSHQQGFNIAPERLTVEAWMMRWLEAHRPPVVRPKTYAAYETLTRCHLIPGLGKTQLAKLQPQDVREFMREKTDAGFSAKTVRHLRATLRAALNVAVHDGLVARNCAAMVKPPRIEKTELKVFGPAEANLFLDAIRGHRWEALFATTLALGLRQGEILGLRWQDIDFDQNMLTVRHALQRVDGKLQLVEPKTEKSHRSIALPQVAVSALYSHRARQEGEKALAGSRWKESGLVFTTTVGTPVDQRRLLTHFHAIVQTAGLPDIRFHDLRHSAATLLLAQGVHPRIVMEILGHSSISLTMNTYSHVIPAMQRAAADQMDAVLNPVAANLAATPETKRLH
jgi:integrase